MFRATTLLIFSVLATDAAANCEVPSYNEYYKIPPGYSASEGFVGEFEYKEQIDEAPPSFLTIDFKSNWDAYIWSVLDYAYEGNISLNGDISDDFDIANNAVRDWYHPIWMHPTRSGREFVHGLTREKPSDPGHLAEGLHESFETWAIGFYNSYGGQLYSKVFQDPCLPDLSNVQFPVGTVSLKLLFTEATSAEIPYLEGSPVWGAAINRVGQNSSDPAPEVTPMTFLQADVAVRDDRANETGWVFGTFVYSAEIEHENPWMRLKPVGLIWGNDPTALPGDAILESKINASLEGEIFGWLDDPTLGYGGRPELGFLGRMNGPADNLISSCTACHGTAQFPRSDDFDNVPPGPVDPTNLSAVQERLNQYFWNVEPGEAFDELSKFQGSAIEVAAFPLDYSLTLQKSLERMCRAAVQFKEPPFDITPIPSVCDPSNYLASAFSVSTSKSSVPSAALDAVDWEAYDAPIR